MTEHIDDMIMVLDNDEDAYTTIKEIVIEVGADDPTEVGHCIKDFVAEGSANRLADRMLDEFMGSVSNRDLGDHYIDVFADEIAEDDEEEADE